MRTAAVALCPVLLSLLSLSAAPSCTSTRACKAGTAFVSVTLDATSATADKLMVSVSVAGAAATKTPLDHAAGQTTGTVEIDFPGGYPQGQSVTVALTATRAGVAVGSGSTDKVLTGACEAITVAVTGAAGDGGVGGNGSGGADAGGGVGGVGVGGAGGAGGAGVGGAGGAGCPTGQNTTCGGVCAATLTDRAHCGATCAVCAANEVCNNACVTAVLPVFVKVPLDPAGWLDPNAAPLIVTVKDTGIPGTIYECRTGPDATFTATTPAWVPCDGATGAGRTHTPVPNTTTPEGNYRTEHRYRADSYVSPVIATRYYVHHSLDKVATCPRTGMTADGPHHTDTDYFAAAQTFATANPALFPTSSFFSASSAPPVRTDAIYLRNPFIKIPFVGVTQSSGMATGEGVGFPYSWPSTGGNYLLNELSLRHAWVMNPGRTMILMKRNYIHPMNHCREEIWVGHAPVNTSYTRHKIACEALVVNARGNGLCLTTGGTVPIPVAVESPVNGAGTVSAATNGTVVTGLATSFLSAANQFIQIPAVTGRWYRIAAAPVPTATTITISPAFAGTTAAGMPYKISPSTTYALATGFAKMHPDAHNYATGVTLPKTPSPKTKCLTLGCNTGLPWMTYLPP